MSHDFKLMPVDGSEAWLEGLLSGQVPGTLQHIVQGLVLIPATAKHQPLPSDGIRACPVEILSGRESYHHHK